MLSKPAARKTDIVSCPLCGITSIGSGSPNVFFDGLPAARRFDCTTCSSVLTIGGVRSVLINGMPSLVSGAQGGHGDTIIGGSSTIMIGEDVVKVSDNVANQISPHLVAPTIGVLSDSELVRNQAQPTLEEKQSNIDTSPQLLITPKLESTKKADIISTTEKTNTIEATSSETYQGLLRTGKNREVLGSKIILSKQPQPVKVRADILSLEVGLQENHFSRHVIVADLINPQKTPYSDFVLNTICNKQGGIAAFNILRTRPTEKAPSYSCLQIARNYSGGLVTKEQQLTLGYWAPQGGFVDVPARPNSGPQYVLTPSFSGCGLVIDQLNEELLRIWHVEGGKEDIQYNNIDPEKHGFGLSHKMEYLDYGFHSANDGCVIENIHGFAFLKFESQDGKWRLYYQGQIAPPSILGVEHDFFGRNFVSSLVSEDVKISKFCASDIALLK